MDEFLEEMCEVLEEDTVAAENELEGFEFWDSLTILSVIALASENYDVSLDADEVTKSKTVGGLWELIQSKK